jgi:hypothetical protein
VKISFAVEDICRLQSSGYPGTTGKEHRALYILRNDIFRVRSANLDFSADG